MKSLAKSILIAGAFSLFLSTHALALPVAGGQVRMEVDYDVPYTMTDLSDGKVYATFCLESQNYFRPGTTYNVKSVSDFAESGGGGAINGRDRISTETKWIYAAFMSDVFGTVRNAAQKVQNAIWYLESETGGSQSDWDTLNNYAFDDSGWNIMAVNITRNGRDNQSQIVGVAPVPEPATMLLLGTGLIGIAGLGRRKYKKQHSH